MKTPRTSPTETIHADWWPEGEDCQVKTFLSGWERYHLRAAMRALHAEHEARSGGLDPELFDYETALLLMEVGVAATTLTFADGTRLEPTIDDFKRLDEPDVEFIVGAIKERLALWKRADPAPATQEEADAARFRGGPADVQGVPGPALGGGDPPTSPGGDAPAGVSGKLGDAPVDLQQSA